MDAPKCKICSKGHYGLCPEAFRSEPPMKRYHLDWLTDRPKRTSNWLREKLADGFVIHHLDGDHSNNSPDNLLLIEGSDHLRLHRKIMPVLRNDKSPFDRITYQRELMRKRRAAEKALKNKP